eukprot:TRINITY_DN5746_c0_g3_i2.p1 TRINITY_DN5746_c0_g3~~TRINITY_DN5746_c0_g3_i2.p1  ORF type:complete len:710 (-),score=156.90 TRINITY_DN5746_c0_g3_i2:260-2389(-)
MAARPSSRAMGPRASGPKVSGDAPHGVKVAIRFRPLNERERAIDREQRPEALSKGFITDMSTVVAYYDLEKLYFQYDQVFTEDTQQEQVYHYAIAPAVDDVLMGYNGTILAYGQTGAGKSYTMLGPPKKLRDPGIKGAIPRVCSQVFREAKNRMEEGARVVIKCSFLQIYQESLMDMMNPSSNLRLRETPNQGVWVDNLTQATVSSEGDLMRMVVAADKCRSVANTEMSERSSRSHSLFTLVVEQSFPDGMAITGKLVLVDLAGSEKVHKSRASGGTLSEACGINKSLSALGNCIQALTEERRGHVPYRDSKLTHLLKDSLGGNTKTSLVVACSPHWSNYEETLSSLRFASRALEMKVVAQVNSSRETSLATADQGNLTDGLKALQSNCSTLFTKLCKLRPGDTLTMHHMSEIQHLTSHCTTQLSRLLQQSEAVQESDTLVTLQLREQLQGVENKAAEERQRHANGAQAQQEAEERAASMSAQVGELEAESSMLREQVERLTDETIAQQHELLSASQQPKLKKDASTRDAQMWKAKYEALKSRLPQMFDLMDSENYASPIRPGQREAHSPDSIKQPSPKNRSPADLEFGLVELQLKYEESQSNLSLANHALAQHRDNSVCSSPGSIPRRNLPHSSGDASLSLSRSLSQSVSPSVIRASPIMTSPLKPSPKKRRSPKSPLAPRTNQYPTQRISPEKALRKAINNTSLKTR